MRGMHGGRGSGSSKGPYPFVGFLFIWNAGSGTSLEHAQHDGKLHLLTGHPSPDRQTDGLETLLQGQGTHRSQLQGKVQAESICRLGLMHLVSDGAWKSKKVQLQLRKRTNGCHCLLLESSPLAQRRQGTQDAWNCCSPPGAGLPALGMPQE